MPIIVIPDDEPAVMSPSAAFGSLSGYDVRTYRTRPSDAAELVDRIGDGDIVINIRSTSKFTPAVLEKCPALRLISIWGTGTDNVDLAAARVRGIRVTNTPGVSAVAVAEHTLALIYPNPLDPEHYVVLNSGLTFGTKEFKGTNALLYPRLGDYAIIRRSDGAVMLAGIFDDEWRLSSAKR